MESDSKYAIKSASALVGAWKPRRLFAVLAIWHFGEQNFLLGLPVKDFPQFGQGRGGCLFMAAPVKAI
jgi:hypothetical protein